MNTLVLCQMIYSLPCFHWIIGGKKIPVAEENNYKNMHTTWLREQMDGSKEKHP